MASLDETNHAVVSLIPTEDDPTRWVSTLAPLTLLKAASKHAARLNEHRMLYTVSDETNSEDTVEGRGGNHGQVPTRGGTGVTQDVAERNMTAEWATLTTGSAIRKTIQVGVPTLAPQMSHHGIHSNDNGVFCNDSL